MQTVEWDFRTPRTPPELGARVDDFREIDGEVDLTVIFPSGRTIAGEWERGARAESAPKGLDDPPLPVSRIVLLELAEDVDELRVLFDRYRAEWGEAQGASGSIDDFLAATDERAALNDAQFGELYAVGENVYGFTGDVRDGIEPSISVRFVDDVATFRTILRFDPVG